MHNSFVVDGANAPINTTVSGPIVLRPYAYFGNVNEVSLNADPAKDDKTSDFNKSEYKDDQVNNIPLEWEAGKTVPDNSKASDPLENFNQCLKRYQIEIGWIKGSSEGDDSLVPAQTEVTPREGDKFTPTQLTEPTAQERMRENFLLDFDTLNLYEQGSNLNQLGRTSSDYDAGAFAARGLPVKLQKVYFYGTKGTDIDSTDTSKSLGNASMTDGRGTLFSTYILTCSAAVNVLNPEYDKRELNTHSNTNFKGGLWKYGEFHKNSQKNEYNEGVDVGWDITTESPLILGDGALGYRDYSVSDIFENNNFVFPSTTEVYYKVPVTLCLEESGEQTQVAGNILFKPDDPDANDSLFTTDKKRPVIHQMRNLISMKRLVDTDNDVCISTKNNLLKVKQGNALTMAASNMLIQINQELDDELGDIIRESPDCDTDNGITTGPLDSMS